MKPLLVLSLLVVAFAANGESRFSIDPSVEITQVHDDNLYFSPDAPVGDRIRRVTPSLALRYVSSRVALRGFYGVDAEEFQTMSSLDNGRARERAGAGIDYHATPRLRLSLGGQYLATDTLSDLSPDAARISTRTRAQQIGFSPSASFQFSPRLSASASASSVRTAVRDGVGTDEKTASVRIAHNRTNRNTFTIQYDHSDAIFQGETTDATRTHSLLAGVSRNIGPRTALTFRAGPRFTNGQASLDVQASFGHRSRFTAVELSLLRTQNTVAGYSGLVETQSAGTRLMWMPSRRLTLHMTPAVTHSSYGDLEGTLLRVGVGVSLAITDMYGLDASYTNARQDGSIDALHADALFSRSTLSIGFTARWASARGGVR